MRICDRRLTGREWSAFEEAILDAFSTLESFDDTFECWFGRSRQQVALGDNLGHIVHLVIRQAEDNEWTSELLQGLRAARPRNRLLRVFAERFELAPQAPEGPALERFVVESNSLLDVERWIAALAEAEHCICRVEVGRRAFGTGFLVGPDLVITNQHVVSGVPGETPPTAVAVRFDYLRDKSGATVNEGQVYRLGDDWLVDASPPSPLDTEAVPAECPTAQQLDFALLRLSEPAGDDPISGGERPDSARPARGWIKIPPGPDYAFAAGTPLFILQHPQAAPLKLALDTNAMIGVNTAGTRVRYRTNTEPGSSGSPCFDQNWNLVALHHVGDPNYAAGHGAQFNQGIPFGLIAGRIRQHLPALEPLAP